MDIADAKEWHEQFQVRKSVEELGLKVHFSVQGNTKTFSKAILAMKASFNVWGSTLVRFWGGI